MRQTGAVATRTTLTRTLPMRTLPTRAMLTRAVSTRTVPARDVQPRSTVATDDRQSLGKIGEDLACEELTRRGYDILERRYRTRYGEIDIIARSGGSLVFVEVKARDGGEFGGAEAAVTICKQQRIVRMAIDFLSRRRLQDQPCRFDVVTIDVSGGQPRIEVYPHAFTA